LPKADQNVGEEGQDQQEDRRPDREADREVRHLAGARVRLRAGPEVPGQEDRDEGRDDDAGDDPDQQEPAELP
jgi:hypothetical protein